MHKRLINEAVIRLSIEPDGPILIKKGESGADPTRPDMEFVRTYHEGRETIYLPGSSLKGVIRSHCEKIARTLTEEGERREMWERLTCNPLKDEARAPDGSCSEKFNRWNEKEQGKLTSEVIFKNSCFVCQMFGNTSLASHVRIADAYPKLPEDYEELDEEEKRKVNPNFTEVRNGVAIDRIFGSVAVGPFQFEVTTKGKFETEIYIKNFTTAQLGLLALALRDLEEQRVFIGFAKSRGLGRVKAETSSVTIKYPPCERVNEEIRTFDGRRLGLATKVLGVGKFPGLKGYGYEEMLEEDAVSLPEEAEVENDEWGIAGVKLEGEQIKELWRACVRKWAEVVRK